MLDLNFDYASCVRNSEKVAWRLDDVIPPGTKLDFARPFLPSALAGDHQLSELSDAERLKLNQITGNAYMNLFGFVEEYIIAAVVEHVQAEMHGDHDTLRALMRFADEEIKHQQLFARYVEAFRTSFGGPCGVLDNAAEVAGAVLSKSPIAVMIMTLHIELMTQEHYTQSVRENTSLDPLFVSLLKHHWLEESQHARIDALELDKLATDASREQITTAFADYVDLLDAIDGLLAGQAKLDVESLAHATGRSFTPAQADRIAAAQHAAYRTTFIVMGLRNRMFMDYMNKLDPAQATKLSLKAAGLAA
ncbi:diiron oxygenase [Nannocystaceae bacterium ST9]